MDLVVVNYRTPQDLHEFMRSYTESQIEVPHSLHVVNVSPTNLDLDVVKDWAQLISFVHTAHESNVGYAYACNDAAYFADREMVAFFNADTRLRPGVVEGCLNWLRANPELAIIGPLQVDENDRITHAGIFGTNTKPFLRGWKEKDVGQYCEERTDCISVSGSAYFVRRSVWDELTLCSTYRECPGVAKRNPLGAMLPTLCYYEETWISYHAREHGYKVGYLGTQRMIHKWHGSIRNTQGEAWAANQMKGSRKLFREACDYHGIDHD